MRSFSRTRRRAGRAAACAVNPAKPGTPPAGATNALSEIENPNPQPGTNNYYIQDGYGGGVRIANGGEPKANYGGGSYVNCADTDTAGRKRRN